MQRRDFLNTAAAVIAGTALPLPASDVPTHVVFDYPIFDWQDRLIGFCREVAEVHGPGVQRTIKIFDDVRVPLFIWAEYELAPGDDLARMVRLRAPRGS